MDNAIIKQGSQEEEVVYASYVKLDERNIGGGYNATRPIEFFLVKWT